MSKAVKSDGVVNKLVLEMCLQSVRSSSGLGKKEEVDKVLRDEDKLKQCNYETLLLAGFAYYNCFNEKNWHIQKHIEIKAQQSAPYRQFKEGLAVAADAGDAPADESPLAKLLKR